MSYRIFHGEMLTPPSAAGNVIINMRNYIDGGGPHKIMFGARCVVADPTPNPMFMSVDYETQNGQIRTLQLASPIDFSGIGPSSMWYAPDDLMNDERHPLGDGSGTDPYGTMQLKFNFGGGAPGAARYSYECIVTVFDGSPAVTLIP